MTWWWLPAAWWTTWLPAQAYVRQHLDIFLTHGEQYMSTRMYRSLAGILAPVPR